MDFNNKPQKASTFILIMYALGQLGWSLANFTATQLLNYFYLPPETETSTTFPVFIFQGLILGILTVVGLINGGSRAFDAFIDPYIANRSDRSLSKLGRRRVFMLWSFIPFALFSFLIYLPPVPYISVINAIWLAFTYFSFHIFLSLYVTPYNALISELGHTPKQRLTISSFISLTFAFGVAIGNSVYILQNYFEQFYEPVKAFQISIAIFSILSAILMLMPIIFVNEQKYCIQHATKHTPMSAIKAVLADKNFRYFLLSDLFYWLALTFVQSGLIYYITVLAKLDKAITSKFTFILLILSFLLYIPINIIANKYGKKILIVFAFLIFTIGFGLISVIGWLPFSTFWQLGILLIAALIPMAICGILPNAIIADIADANGKKTGDYKAGIYFGVRILIMKLGVSVSSLCFSSLLMLGKSTQNDTGIRLTGIVAMGFCLLGLLFFLRYNEKEVLLGSEK